MKDYYPDWLGRDLVAKDLPRDREVEASMSALLSEYTLHDSSWIGIYLRPNFGATALIRWDTFWSRGKVTYPGNLVAEWPILLIQFERVYRTLTSYPSGEERGTFSGLTETIAGAESALLPPAQREVLLEHALRTSTGPDALDEFYWTIRFTARSSVPYSARGWSSGTEETRASSVSAETEKCWIFRVCN